MAFKDIRSFMNAEKRVNKGYRGRCRIEIQKLQINFKTVRTRIV